MSVDTKYKFKTKGGWLTSYALACGYVERGVSLDESECITLDSRHGLYNIEGPSIWKSFECVTEAREAFKEELKKCGMERVALCSRMSTMLILK